MELHIVVASRLGLAGLERLEKILDEFLFEVVAVDDDQVSLAKRAYERFGKGRHPARLNIGDVLAYAVSKSRNVPLLFKGNDFTKTDVTVCTAD